MNQILARLPASNKARVAVTSKTMRNHVKRGMEGPVSPHPLHDRLHEPEMRLVTLIAKRFKELRDFFDICIEKNRPGESMYNYNTNNINNELIVPGHPAQTRRRQERKELTKERYDAFVRLWNAHSKIPPENVTLVPHKISDYHTGCNVVISCGSLYSIEVFFSLYDTMMSIIDFCFKNKYALLDLIIDDVKDDDALVLDRDFNKQLDTSLVGSVWTSVQGRRERYKELRSTTTVGGIDALRGSARVVLIFDRVLQFLYARNIDTVYVDDYFQHALSLRTLLRKSGFNIFTGYRINSRITGQ